MLNNDLRQIKAIPPSAVLGLLIVLGLAVRVATYLFMRHTHLFTVPFLDSSDYDLWARRLVSGDWGKGEPYWMGPLYPHLLALVYRVFGVGGSAMMILQWGLSLGNVALVYAVGRRWADTRTGLLAAALYSAYGPPVFYAGLRLMVTVVTTLVLLIAWQAWRAWEQPQLRRWLVLGLLVGLTATARGNVLVLTLTLPWLLRGRGLGGRSVLCRVAMLVLGVALAVLPVTVRNLVVGGDLVLLTSNGGVNLLIGQQDQYGGIFGPITRTPSFEFDPTGAIRLEAEEGHDLAPSQVSHELTRRAVTRFTSEPKAMVRHYARKVVRFWSGYELPQIVSWNFWRTRLMPLRWLFLPFAVLSAGGLLGMAWLRPPARGVWLAVVGGYFLSLLPFFPTTRYRLPIVPLLAISTAAFALALGTLPRHGSRRRVVVWSLAAVGMLVALWPSWTAFPRNEEFWYCELNRASRAADAGDRVGIFSACAAAEVLEPGLAETAYRQGGYLEKAGDSEAALASYDEAMRRLPNDRFIQYRRARCLAALHRTSAAEAGFMRAAALDTTWAAPYHGLALVRREAGDLAGAVEAMAEAVAREPGRARYRSNLASLYAECGRFAAAARVLARLTEDFPDYVPGWYNLARLRWQQGRFDEARTLLRHALTLPAITDDEQRQIAELSAALSAGTTAPDQ